MTADLLLPERVLPLLRGRFGRPLIHRESCSSTQELARGRAEGTVATCELQTAGRGRGDRRWRCPRSAGVLFSLALQPRTDPDRLAPLSLVVAEAVCRALHPLAAVKWPNDVLVDGRKLAGVLLEVRGPALTVGVGINANLHQGQLPAETRLPATSLSIEAGRPVDRAQVLADVLAEIEAAYRTFERDGFRGVARGRDHLAGRTVSVGGDPPGRCQGIQSDGSLLVGGHAYRSGEAATVAVAGV